MRRFPGLLVLLALGFAALAMPGPARANLLISIDKHAQQMTVTVDGDPRYVWPVSTGRGGYNTPGGQFQPFRMERDHFSREWDDAPMPYSIFFTKQGHAIHGTNHKIDGSPESHGCVRLSVAHAAILWALVKQNKMANTRVELIGHIPNRNELLARRELGNEANTNNADRGDIANDPDVTGDIPPPPPQQQAGGWHEYREGGRTYYYREGPDEVRRIERRVRRYYRRYRYGGFPFW
jgi:L,D-transpeptidase catalytic domain